MTRRRDFEAGKQAFENVLELASAKKSLVQIRGLGTLVLLSGDLLVPMFIHDSFQA
jgi:hypothetical protein